MMIQGMEMEELSIVQLQEELRTIKEKYQALLRSGRESRMQELEAEAEKARESERRMLESLECQTKQLEQTKILLEEAKLEIISLSKAVELTEASPARGGVMFGNNATPSVVPRDHEEICVLRTELKLAIEAEEKSKKAMDDLALVLKEVTTESNSFKEKLFKAHTELNKMREERDHLMATLKQAEAELRTATNHTERLKLEVEESFTSWNEKENGFLKCVKMCEEEIINMKKENDGLFEYQKSAREEISKLRDILKQAINEATVVKDALEIARTENSHMKDMLSEKDIALQGVKNELECLKVSEAAAVDSVKELQSLLVAVSTLDLSRPTKSIEKESSPEDGALQRRPLAKFPSEKWRGRDRPQLPRGRRLSLGDSERFEGSIFDMIGSPDYSSGDQSHAVLERRSGKAKSHGGHWNHIDERQHDGTENEWDSPTRQKKKRQILRRMGELLTRRNSHK